MLFLDPTVCLFCVISVPCLVAWCAWRYVQERDYQAFQYLIPAEFTAGGSRCVLRWLLELFTCLNHVPHSDHVLPDFIRCNTVPRCPLRKYLYTILSQNNYFGWLNRILTITLPEMARSVQLHWTA